MPWTVVAIILLSLWIGAAMLVTAVVAPAAFAVLPTRALAGAVVGRVLPVVFWSGMLVGIVVAALGRWLPHSPWRTGAAVALVGACAAAQLVIAPRIAAIRQAAGGAIDMLDPGDPRRQAFGRLHGLSVAWMAVGGLAAIVALVILVRHTVVRTTT